MKKSYIFGLLVVLALVAGCKHPNAVKPATKSEMVITVAAARDDGSPVAITPKDLKVTVKNLPTGFTVIETEPFKIGKMPFTMVIKYTIAPNDPSRKADSFEFNNFEGTATVLKTSNPIFMSGKASKENADLTWKFTYGKNSYVLTLKK